MKRLLTQPIEIFATGSNYAAKGLFYPDGKVKLFKGSILCPYATNSTRTNIVALRNEILHKKAVGTTLSSDVVFDTQSEAASVIAGSMRNGNEFFRTVDNIPLGEYIEPVQHPNTADSSADEHAFVEGESSDIVLNQYERNRRAREACIRHYGSRCAICGFDFEATYGNDFRGIIQVHHIVPISEIGHEYTVDPIKDLIPVCPNCHVALHSKKGGVYTPDELKELLKRRNSNGGED